MSTMLESETPRVSVITATRNRSDLLERALSSIAAQTLRDFEAIVVDDGSDEKTFEDYDRIWARSLDRRFYLEKPICPSAAGTGPSRARNRGLQRARGEFVAFLDDDDVWVENDFLKLGVESLRDFEADYFFCDLAGIRDGHLVNPGWVPDPAELVNGGATRLSPEVYSLSRTQILRIARRFMIHPGNSIVRRSVLQAIDGFFTGLWSRAEDVNLMLRIIDQARAVLYSPKCAVHYRLPLGDSISLTEGKLLHRLQDVLAAQHARLTCKSPDLRRCARAREAWGYRELYHCLAKEGRLYEALGFAWQSLCTYPTLGSANMLLAAIVKRLFR